MRMDLQVRSKWSQGEFRMCKGEWERKFLLGFAAEVLADRSSNGSVAFRSLVDLLAATLSVLEAGEGALAVLVGVPRVEGVDVLDVAEAEADDSRPDGRVGVEGPEAAGALLALLLAACSHWV
jgi:hypothetical protein